jgi:hypothetical protein
MDELFDTIKEKVIKRIKDAGEINNDFLMKYINDYDGNFHVDLDIILEDFDTELQNFIDDSLYGIDDYKKELLEDE